MAFVRLLCFPSTSQFYPKQSLFLSQTAPLLSSLSKPLQFNHALFPPFSSLRLSPALLIKTQNSNPFVFRSSVSIQAQTTVEAPEVEVSETVKPEEDEEEEDDDEASRTRLLAQNVPWTSTVDDIRPLFEQYGTVVDIEVSALSKISPGFDVHFALCGALF